jgi:uncharacterized protein YjeT (DUF2065 family)
MLTHLVWAAAGVFIIEGLLPLLAPVAWRAAVQKIAVLQDGQIRFYGLLLVLSGLLLAIFFS